ncbi:MAG TPA: hypothetical protein VG820_04720, partial [Fimbriimonadaceae bacterium]|nr:hypothetical protein [Fimbriimonadaceae bacterium]
MRFLWLFLLAVLALALAGCGGGGNSLPQLPVFVPGSVSSAERYAAYDEVEAFFDTVGGQPDATAQVVAKMKTMPQFATAEVATSGQAVGWFKDGQMYVVFTVDEDGTTPAGHHQAQSLPKSRDLPAGTAAYVIDAFEPARQDASSIIGPELAAKGYNVQLMSGTVNDYMSIQDAGVLVVHAHGILHTNKFRVPAFWYATSEAPTSDHDDL